MPQDGEMFSGTATETLAGLRENPALMTETHFPAQGVTLNMSYVEEDGTYVVRVHMFGTEPTPETILSWEGDLTEEEVIWRMGILAEREASAKEDPFQLMVQQLLREMGE